MGYFSGGGAPTSAKRSFFADDGTPAPANPDDTAPGEAPYSFKAETNKKDLAEALHRLHAAGDTKNFNLIAAQAGSVFTPDDIKKYGLDQYGQGEGNGKSWGSRFMGNVAKTFQLGDTVTGGMLSKGLGVLDRPSKRSLAVLGDLRRGHFTQAGEAVLTGAADALPVGMSGSFGAAAQLHKAVPDTNEDGQINMREVLGLKAGAGGSGWAGRAAGAADTAGILLTDPTTYMTLGASGLAKSGMKTISAEFGEDMARKIAQNGLKGALDKGLITELEHEGIKTALKQSAEDLVVSAAKKRGVRKLVEKEGAEKAAQTLADESYDAVAKSGRSGLRIGIGDGKRTVLPSNPFGKSLIPGLQAKFEWQTEKGLAAKAAQEAAGELPTGATTSKAVRRTIGGVLGDTAAGERLKSMFIPRAATTAKFGASTSEKVYSAVEQAAATSGRNINDMMIQVAHISGESAKEFKSGAGEALTTVMPEMAGRKGYEAMNDVVLGVLEGTLDSTAVKTALAADGMSQSVKAVEAFEDVARQQADAVAATRGAGFVDRSAEEATAAALKQRAIDAVKAAPAGRFGKVPISQRGSMAGGRLLQNVDDVLPETMAKTPGIARILTPEAEALAKGDKQKALTSLFGTAAGDLRQGTDMTAKLGELGPEAENSLGHAVPTHTYAEMPIRQVNEDLVHRLGLEAGTKIFVDDALTGIALRGKTAFQAAAQTDIFEKLAQESINGEPLVSILRPSDGALKRAAFAKMAEENGWKQLDSGEGKKLALGEVWGPPEIMDDLSKMHDMIVNDESLKAFSNFLNKWNGIWASYATVPVVFGTGFHSRNSIGNTILAFMGGLTNPAKYAQATVVQWGVAQTRALMKKDGLNFEEALAKQVKSPRTRQLITDMREHGIISNGFFADISGDEVDNVLRHNSLKDWMNPKKIIPRVNDNQLIRTGRKVGDVVENNARVALYMDAFDKMGNVQNAANHVKKYLFDYQDLTPFERRYMKSANRFYTFTRKNVAVQMYTLAHDPWRIATANKLEGMLYNHGDTQDANLPDYARKGGFQISRLLGKPQGTDGVGMNIDTPFDNAVKTLDPIMQGISMIPGLQQVVPPEYRSNKGELAKSIVGLRAGGPVEFINFLMEQSTGKDLYSGKDISKEGKGKTFERLANAFVPLYSKGDTFSDSAINPAKLITGGFGKDETHPGMTARLALMQSLVGFQVLPITDKQTNQVAFAGAQEAMDALSKLKAEGIDVPTYTDLVALGIAPDLRTKTDKKKSTPAQTAKARVDKLNAARSATGAAPLSVTPPKTTATKKSYF